ncbi:MAG: right-handed parallel beta-helix repeat-containing protein [Ignavibacterium sp.]|nr:right-handed parallel beta-helix repeat-containing protein [Ignavibacterium sp.]
MKKIFLLLVLFSAQLFAQYTTPNTGVNWSLDDLVTNSGGVVTGSFPNYTINQKVIVSVNDQVNVLPGSVVTFTAATSGFEVNGIFQAIGTAADSIVFTSSVPDSTGYYEGFRFNENTSANVSTISYAKIFYADYGFRCISVSPVLSNSHLFKCGRGVQLSGSNATIQNNVIERSYEYAITMTLGSSPLIENNYLIKNNTRGVSALNQISIGLQGNNSPIIRNNIIEGGESVPTGGISLWVSGASASSNAIIEGNEIFNNSFGMTLLSSSNGVINAVVRDNIIYNNNINPNAQVSGSGINVNGSPFNQPVITRNIIYGNWWGITIQNGTTVQPGPQPNIGNIENADTTDDGQNIIFNNIQGTNVYDMYNNCTNDIYAQNNDWGVYDSTLIENNIFHKVDNPAHGLVIFTPFSGPIPVELVSFTAIVTGTSVQLSWSTASETNNVGFEIERSVISNGVRNLTWEEIGFVEGKGTSTEIQNYSFTDQNVVSGTNAYRLKQIDFDGSFTYSNLIEVEFILPVEFVLEQNYPNPFNPSTKIRFVIPKEVRNLKNFSSQASRNDNMLVTLKVFDVLGNEVATIFNEYQPAGIYEVEFNASSAAGGLSSGVYFYKLRAGNFIQTKKLLLLK